MKKRILSLLLAMTMIFSLFSAGTAYAQTEAENTSQQSYSMWAYNDLLVGDTYGIYPYTWYQKGMQKPITASQLRTLISGLRQKLLKTDCVIDYDDIRIKTHNNMTVKEVLEALYALISSYNFKGDISVVDGETAVKYMAKVGAYTGNEYELSLDDICSVEQACVIATRLVTYIYDALDAASKGFLWEIKSGGNTAYLLGSVHLADYDIYPFSNKILEAYASADYLGVEIDLFNPAVDGNAILAKYGIYNDGTTLKDHVSEETYQKTVQICSAFGMTEDVVAMYEPWALYIIFSSYANSASETDEEANLAKYLGIDMKFMIDAYSYGKPVIELEGYELQMSILDSFSDELQETLLNNTMDSLAHVQDGNESLDSILLDVILDYWHDGDVEGFMKNIAPLLAASESTVADDVDDKAQALNKEYNTKIFTERDTKMAEKIDQFLRAEGSTTYFIVVGTGHYISNHSVLDILKEKGYEINQIK